MVRIDRTIPLGKNLGVLVSFDGINVRPTVYCCSVFDIGPGNKYPNPATLLDSCPTKEYQSFEELQNEWKID